MQSTYKSFVLALSVAAASVAFAGGPVNQLSSNNGTVRILVSNANTNFATDAGVAFNGSGTVIDHKNINGQGWICILTADHVLSTTASAAGASFQSIGIGSGNSANPNGSSSGFKANMVMRSAARRTDIAVLGVNYGTFNAAFNQFKRTVWDGTGTPTAFTGEGFGAEMTDDSANSRWNRVANYGVRRRWNMNGFTISAGANATFNDYDGSQTIEWKPKAVGSMTSLNGHGQGADGDSGGAYFVGDPETITTTLGTTTYYRSSIFGTQSFGSFINGNANDGVAYGSRWGGVYLNAANRTWIQQQCSAVPEPTSIAALAAGLTLLLRKKRATKS